MPNADSASDKPTKDEEEQRVEHLVELASAVFGGTAAGAVALTGGPLGALAAGVIGPTVQFVVSEIWMRYLAPRARARAGLALIAARQRIVDLRAAGRSVRNDGFFDEDPAGSEAAEIAEGVLVAAISDHEEKKARFYGNLWASIAFDEEIDRGFANLLLRRAQQLSYRQLCLLSIVGQRDRYPLRPDRVQDSDTWDHWAVLEELDELGFSKLEMIGVEGEPGRVPPLGVPSELRLNPRGQVLYELMNLADIPEEDLRSITALFGANT